MKKGRIFLTLALSLVLAFAAFQMANSWMRQRLEANTEVADVSPVVVAAVDIPFGARLEPTHVRVIDWPSSAVPDGAFHEAEDVLGRIATQTIVSGELLLAGRVVEHAGGSTLASFISEGMRAVAVRVDDVRGVAGFLLPGNYVDVMAIRRGKDGPRSRTILENIKVLAVDQTASPDKNGPVVVRAVTLEVTPEQAESIAKAMEAGKVQLTLRNPKDASRVARVEPPAAESAEADEPPPVVVESSFKRVFMIRGTRVSESETCCTTAALVP
jgi:pilus assembly protein CpaB